MPALGADMEAGTLVEWQVKVGDRVRSGDIVAVVETQKGAIEVEIFLEGVVSKLLVVEGQRVPVGTVLAEIEGAEAAAAAPAGSMAAARAGGRNACTLDASVGGAGRIARRAACLHAARWAGGAAGSAPARHSGRAAAGGRDSCRSFRSQGDRR